MRRPQLWLSPDRLSDAIFVGLLTLLEVLPIQAALLMYAAGATGSLEMTFGPLWVIVVALLAFALARWRLGRSNPILLTLVILVIGVVAVALFVALSPTAYGAIPGGLFSFDWLQQLQVDASEDTPQFNSLFAIVPFVVYLGWRGLALGASLPKIGPALRRYTVSLTVVMVACVGAMAAPEAAQPSLQGALLTLLALDVFAGLAAAALARRGDGRESGAEVASGAETTRWLLTAFGAAALVVALAFGLGLLLSLRLAHTLFVALGAVGSAVSAAMNWLAIAVANVLWFIFVNTLGRLLLHKASPYIPPQQPLPIVPKQPAKHQVLTPPPHELVMAATILVVVIVAALLLFALYLAIRKALRLTRVSADPEVDEEREALDARGLLRRQLGDLFARMRRRPALDVDPLAPGSVRWLYREMLRAGAEAGVARRTGETADEYSQRLARFAQERGAGGIELSQLTRAYDDARYGEHAVAAPPEVVAEARDVATALAKLGAER